MAVSMGGVVLWGRILGGSYAERSKGRKPDQDDENKRSARKPKGLFGSIADGILALGATGISGFLAVATMHDAIGLLTGAAYPAFPLIALAGAAAFYTGRFAYRRYANVIESAMHHWGNPGRNNNASQMTVRPERTVQPVSAPKPVTNTPAARFQNEKNDIIQTLTAKSAPYAGKLKDAASETCGVLRTLAETKVREGTEISRQITNLFKIVSDQVFPMMDKLQESGGQTNNPSGASLLKNCFNEVTEAAQARLSDVEAIYANDLDIAAQVLNASLKQHKPDPVYAAVVAEREKQSAAAPVPA